MKSEPTRVVGAGGIGAVAWIGAIVGLSAPGLVATAWSQDGGAPAGQPVTPLPGGPRPDPTKSEPAKPEPAKPEAPKPEPPTAEAPKPEAPKPEGADQPAHGQRYLISRFSLEYGREAPGLPNIDDLYSITVELAKSDLGYTATADAPAGSTTVTVRLSDIQEGPGGYFYASAVRSITTAIVENLKKRGFVGLFVVPHPDDIDEATDADLRKDRTAMRLQIWVAVVKQIRTIASGERISKQNQRIDNPKHDRIREGSVAQVDSLLTRQAIDDYVFRLNRHPGRRVDVAVSAAGDQTGDVVLDYLVSENRPWSAFAQISNTGTRSTDEWQERFGFVHNQLTGNDDILRLDFLTAGFSKTNAFIGSYEFPAYTDTLRVKTYFSASQFQASDLGIRDEQFSGTSWTAGAEAAWNVLQAGPSFIDLVGGAHWDHVTVMDEGQGTKGVDDFFLPYWGARYSRDTDDATTYGSAIFESTLSGVSNTDRDEVEQLGRRDVDLNWVVLKWELGQSFYVEPLLNRAGWASKHTTLAHEISFSGRGQWAYYDDRMIPQAEEVAGGLYTVRGYPESVVAGDTVYIGTAEYRIHIARLLGIDPNPKSTFMGETFRWRASEPFGRPDWDLIFRTFVDAGRVENSHKIVGEQNDSLLGVGFGFELQLRRNLFIRTDFGWALDEIKDADLEVSAGSSRAHFSATFVY